MPCTDGSLSTSSPIRGGSVAVAIGAVEVVEVGSDADCGLIDTTGASAAFDVDVDSFAVDSSGACDFFVTPDPKTPPSTAPKTIRIPKIARITIRLLRFRLFKISESVAEYSFSSDGSEGGR